MGCLAAPRGAGAAVQEIWERDLPKVLCDSETCGQFLLRWRADD